MQKQVFDKKEPELVEIDRFSSSIAINQSNQDLFTKIRQSFNELQATIIKTGQPFNELQATIIKTGQPSNELQATIAKIRQPFNELQATIVKIRQPLNKIDELQATIAKIRQPSNELQATIAKIRQPFKQIDELQATIAKIRQSSNELQATITKIGQPFNELQATIIKTGQPSNELQATIAKIRQPFNELQATIVKIRQPRLAKELQAPLALNKIYKKSKLRHKPRLIVVAGPNGAGKTTFTKRWRQHIWLDDTTYVNPDNIAQEKFGGWDNKKSFIEAANYAQKIRENCLKNKESLVFETVFSTDEKIDFVKKAIDAGFFIRFFFIATDDTDINTNRILSRIYEGGHQVPSEKIRKRRSRSINNCSQIVNLVDRVYVYDNSIDKVDPQLIFRVANKDKQVVKKYQSMLGWTKIIFDNIQ